MEILAGQTLMRKPRDKSARRWGRGRGRANPRTAVRVVTSVMLEHTRKLGVNVRIAEGGAGCLEDRWSAPATTAFRRVPNQRRLRGLTLRASLNGRG